MTNARFPVAPTAAWLGPTHVPYGVAFWRLETPHVVSYTVFAVAEMRQTGLDFSFR